jgi:hypothetical protein
MDEDNECTAILNGLMVKIDVFAEATRSVFYAGRDTMKAALAERERAQDEVRNGISKLIVLAYGLSVPTQTMIEEPDDQPKKGLIGTVKDVRFTVGGVVSQWTTIDGLRCATYWDPREREWNIGDRVEFDLTFRPLSDSSKKIPHAENIRRIRESAVHRRAAFG